MKLIAFIHIEKAAGTTLNHILRKNFFLKYIDVRPLSEKSNGIFSPEDLKKYLIINPKLKCISGHSIFPTGNISKLLPEVEYFTVLRDPLQRYISQYEYLVKIKRIPDSFELFLSDCRYNNFQTKKIAGKEDLHKAKIILKNKLFEVGAVEEFDTFLLRMKRKLKPLRFDPCYKIQNVTGKSRVNNNLFDQYGEQIEKNNQLDLGLYKFTKNFIIPNENKKYGEYQLKKDLNEFQNINKHTKTSINSYIDYLIRKIYYEPVTGYLRKRSAMPRKGSY